MAASYLRLIISLIFRLCISFSSARSQILYTISFSSSFEHSQIQIIAKKPVFLSGFLFSSLSVYCQWGLPVWQGLRIINEKNNRGSNSLWLFWHHLLVLHAVVIMQADMALLTSMASTKMLVPATIMRSGTD